MEKMGGAGKIDKMSAIAQNFIEGSLTRNSKNCLKVS